MSLLSSLGSLPPEERKEMGQKLNETKAKIASLKYIQERLTEMKDE